MEKFTLDKEKAKLLARELGLEVSFDSVKSGVLIKKEDAEMLLDFDHFFPEISLIDQDKTEPSKLVTKDEGTIDIVVSHAKLPIINPMKTKVIVTSTFDKPGSLIRAS